jgi:hypothetical protein
LPDSAKEGEATTAIAAARIPTLFMAHLLAGGTRP